MIPKYEAIAADIRRSIEDGALKPGDKLPTVVEFSLPAVVDRVPTLRTRRDFPARRFSRAKTTVPRAFRMSTAGKR